MKRTLYPACLVLFVTLTSGCAAQLTYGYDKTLYKRPQKTSLSAVVRSIHDLRTEDEQKGTFSTTDGYLYTSDDLFKKDIGKQATAALVKHIEKANIFTAVVSKQLENFSLENAAEIEKLVQEGFDILILGDLYHLYGYQSGTAGPAVLFGLTGVLLEAMANKKVVGGRASLGDVKIIDLRKKEVLWEGDVDHDFERKDTFYDGPPAYAIEALKQANDKLVKTIGETVGKLELADE